MRNMYDLPEKDIISTTKKYGVKKVVLFGSRSRSDMDIAVSG